MAEDAKTTPATPPPNTGANSDKITQLESLTEDLDFDKKKLKKTLGISRITQLYTETSWAALVKLAGSDDPEVVKTYILNNYPK